MNARHIQTSLNNPANRRWSLPMGDSQIAQLQREYLSALRREDERDADQIVQGALENGWSVHSIYLDLFQPVLYEIGNLWQRKVNSVAQQHLAIAIIERQMCDLHPHFRPCALKHKTALIGCVAEELHCIGVRMVSDFLEHDGWTVHYLGAGVPTETFISIARELNVDLICVSALMINHLPSVVELVYEADRRGMAGLPIMAGGQPFIQMPNIYRALGVHYCGRDAREAVIAANQRY